MEHRKPRILLTTPFPDTTLVALHKSAKVDIRYDLSETQLETIIGDYNAIIVDGHTPVSGRIIEYGYKLQAIGVAGASLDHVNVSAALAQDVQIINIPDTRTLALAELTLSLMLELSHRKASVGLAGKTLGIIGFGAVGNEVSKRAEAFGMKVIVNQPKLTPELALELKIRSVELSDLLRQSDIVCVLLPSNPETINLLDTQCLLKMKAGSCLINAGSSEVLDMEDIEKSMREEVLASAAVRLPSDHPYKPPADFQDRITVFHYSHPTIGRTDDATANQIVEEIIQTLQKRQTGNPLSLKVVPVSDIFPHEYFDPERVADLAERLQSAKTLVNPPVVAEWEDKYVVLDGATRTNAFKRLEYAHIVVQVVSPKDDQIHLHTWYHALHGPTRDELFDLLSKNPAYHLQLISDDESHTTMKENNAICSININDGTRYWVFNAPDVDFLTALNQLVTDYTSISHIHRTLNTDFATLETEIDSIVALVIFPQFQIEDVLIAAVKGTLLPAGITRFVIPGRVLRLHADMEVLRTHGSLLRKNIWLDRLLSDKLARRRVRYYQEPIFLLDE